MRSVLFFLIGIAFALLAYNALFIIHYDVDFTGVLASVLGLRIETLGFLSAGASVLCFAAGIVFWR